MAEIRSDGKTVATYSYDKLGNLLGKQLADGTQELYRHDTLGRITEMTVKSATGKTLTQVAYTWDNADQLVRRTWDGKVQNYVYDEAGQLTGVKSEGLPEEQYAYDPAGNMIEKMIGNDKTAMTYDLANRLLTATGKQEARYAYDPAGRIKEEILGGRTTQYKYGLLGKVSRVKEGDARSVDYQCWPDGQTAWKESRQPDAQTSKSETYLWDGLALLARGEEKFTVEPHISGGVPLMASGKEGQTVVISDFLGTTLGVVKGEEFIPTPLTAFGETSNREPDFEGFFTGKPYDPDLKAYTFLFRNYRPELGRWTAADPAGFPDGANNMLYVNNRVLNVLDPIGLLIRAPTSSEQDAINAVLNGLATHNNVNSISSIVASLSPRNYVIDTDPGADTWGYTESNEPNTIYLFSGLFTASHAWLPTKDDQFTINAFITDIMIHEDAHLHNQNPYWPYPQDNVHDWIDGFLDQIHSIIIDNAE